MQEYSDKIAAMLARHDVSAEYGLTSVKAAELLRQTGENALIEQKKKSLLKKFAEQFKDVMIMILLFAAAISFVIALIEKNAHAFFEPGLIVFIVLLNAAIGVAQENKAEKALDALKLLSAPRARAVRDGQDVMLDARVLVPGDIIKLEAGDFVPADSLLLQSSNLKCEESALTGESVPSEKFAGANVPDDAALGDRVDKVFSSCGITYGTATAVVVATGMNTEMGKIAQLLHDQDDGATPLQQKLAALGKNLGILAIAACAVIFIIGILDGIRLLEIFMTSVSLAVSAIPEGLPAIVTIILAIGVQRMVKKNAIIRRLPAVETLGGASVICSDKTGTLTQNRMTLVSAMAVQAQKPEEINIHVSDDVKMLLKYGALCSNGAISIEGENVTHIGDPTETAIIYAAAINGMDKAALDEANPRLGEIPFDSDRKLMSTINRIDGRNIVIVKGAFDVLAEKCNNVDDAIIHVSDGMGESALRVLAIAYKEISEVPGELLPDEIENQLTLMGIVGMIDPPRENAKHAVEICRQAGIKPVMITGDHIITACAIAKQLGILREGDDAITGRQLDAMSDDELDASVENISVYARVSPENKIRIVNAWKHREHVVAMTGDGVNDAPALKAADIGCAMGIAGTDVAKSAADMTLADDNFATIVDAVREGRGIYANIRKVVGFLLGTNIGEVITVFVAMLIWRRTPLVSMQLLWINLVTDSLPAIALGMEAVEPDIMHKKPRRKGEGIFAGGLGLRVLLQGAMFAGLTLISYYIGFSTISSSAGQTMAFTTLAFTQLFHSYNMRSDKSLFAIGAFTNKALNGACAISAALMLAVLFTPAYIAFNLVILPATHYIWAFVLSALPVIIVECVKFFSRLISKTE